MMMTLRSWRREWFASRTGRGTLHHNASSSLLVPRAVYLFFRGQETYPWHSASQTITNPRPRTKFSSVVGVKCIQNYSDRVLPTLILYRNGEIKEQLVARGTKQEATLEDLYPRLPQDYHEIRFSSSRPVQQVPLQARRPALVPTPEFGVQQVPRGALKLMRFTMVEPSNHRAWRLREWWSINADFRMSPWTLLRGRSC